jgi:hypothetical protein
MAEVAGVPLPQLLVAAGIADVGTPKSNRSLPLPVQLGRMDAMTYALRFTPPLIVFEPSPQMTSLPVASTPAPTPGPTPTVLTAPMAPAAPAVAGSNNNSSYFAELLQLSRVDDAALANAARPVALVTVELLASLRASALTVASAIVAQPSWAAFTAPVVEALGSAIQSSHAEVSTAAATALTWLRDANIDITASVPAAVRALVDPAVPAATAAPLAPAAAINALAALLPVAPTAFPDNVAVRLSDHLTAALARVQVWRCFFFATWFFLC